MENKEKNKYIFVHATRYLTLDICTLNVPDCVKHTHVCSKESLEKYMDIISGSVSAYKLSGYLIATRPTFSGCTFGESSAKLKDSADDN